MDQGQVKSTCMPREDCVDEICMSYFQEIKETKMKILTKRHETYWKIMILRKFIAIPS